MTKWIFVLIASLTGFSTQAQLFKPEIRPGTTFFYTLNLHGQQAQLELSVKNLTDSLTLEWRFRRLAGGTYTMTAAARQRASRLNFAQPVPNVNTRLTDQETFLVLSRKAFQELATKGTCTYDNTTYILQKDDVGQELKVNDKPIDTWHIKAREETTELWIFNNPDLPMVCGVKNNPMGVDFTLTAIK